jgi:hypothetical protein
VAHKTKRIQAVTSARLGLKMRNILIAVLYFAVVAFLMFQPARVESSERLARLLAQTCIAEIGFQPNTDECQLMWHINADNARRHKRTLWLQTKLFNAFWHEHRNHQGKRPWIKHLHNAKRPSRWPNHLSWESHRPIWLEYLNAAKYWLRFPGLKSCNATNYGAPGEIPETKSRRVICLGGKTKQRYWRVK